ncbi:GDP-mannose 4,6-dehydratase [Nocardia abscessus]|uniref:GDP-mannose 4,6-dehydratase n=1 Tax=Nocardia abscessus TaxID=120957 RepID=UPI003CC80716
MLHFAASIEVAESVSNPDKYRSATQTNTGTTTSKDHWHCCARSAPRVIFSSTGSMYTGDGTTAFDETAEVRPKNPYAATKAAVDQLIAGECGASDTLGAAVYSLSSSLSRDATTSSISTTAKGTRTSKSSTQSAKSPESTFPCISATERRTPGGYRGLWPANRAWRIWVAAWAGVSTSAINRRRVSVAFDRNETGGNGIHGDL